MKGFAIKYLIYQSEKMDENENSEAAALASIRRKRMRSVDDQGDAQTTYENPLLKKWRKKARTVARLDILLPISYIILKLVHSYFTFTPDDTAALKPRHKPGTLPVLIISSIFSVIFSLVELYTAVGLLTATQAHIGPERALLKTSCWLCYQIFLLIALNISGLLVVLYRRNDLGDAILAFFLALVHLIFIGIVRRYMRYLGQAVVARIRERHPVVIQQQFYEHHGSTEFFASVAPVAPVGPVENNNVAEKKNDIDNSNANRKSTRDKLYDIV